MARRIKILIAAGGTAGHVVPALTVADELSRRGVDVSFVGGERAETELVPAAGYPLASLAVEGIDRRHPLRALRGVGRAAAALPIALRLVKRLQPHAVLGGGGYVSGPVGLAALLHRVPLVLTEADSHLGLANRLLAPSARRVCLAFPLAGRQGERYRLTGRPVPAVRADRAQARKRLRIEPRDRCVLVFGGSLGARSINLAAVQGLRGLRVLHICGKRDYPQLAARQLPSGYDLIEYLDCERFDEALAAADLVVARAGGSVFEIAAHRLPAILVPFPRATADHQSANARWMRDAGAAVVLADDELTAASLRGEVDTLLADDKRLAEMADASARLARPQAAAAIADELIAAAHSRERAGRSSR